MAQPVIDQFSDHGFKVLNQRIRQFPEIDDYVKEAKLDPVENEKRASTAFAWEDERLFPIDTPAHAALSRVYMEKQAGVPKEVVEKCDKALSLYQIDMPLNEKTASVPEVLDNYLLPDIKRLWVDSPEDVKLASEAVLRNNRRMDVNTKALASVNLIKKAAKFNTPVHPTILKYAGVTMCNTKNLKDWVEVRSNMTADENIMQGYHKFAQELDTLPPIVSNRDGLLKTAAVLHELDTAAELSKFYGTKLQDPMLSVFNMDKVADEMLNLAGRQVPTETLLAIDPDIYRDAFGDDLVQDFIDATGEIDPEQLKIILPTVPLDLQRALAAQMGI